MQVTEDEVGVSNTAMQNWRNDLGVNQEFLVSIAWALDQEIEEYDKYPEYIDADVTFGLNQRILGLLAVVDGDMKSSIVYRCLVPSKERRAYSWLFSCALPFLLGTRSRSCSVVAMDNESPINV